MNDIRYEKTKDKVIVLTFDCQGHDVNIMNAGFRASLKEAVCRIFEDLADIQGIIFSSAKGSFFAGGDLNELLALGTEDQENLYQTVEDFKQDLRKIETCGRPVVAAINGSALGGGWEIALSAHYRIAIDDPDIRVGLPEVSLGLLPGAGGVVRTIRMLGFEQGLPLLIEGKTFPVKIAYKMGLLNGLCSSKEEMIQRGTMWIQENLSSTQAFDKPDYRIPGGTPSQSKLGSILPMASAMLMDKTKGCYPAPEAILACAVESMQVDVDTAFRIESRSFASLATGQIAKNMITAFWFQMNEIKQGSSRPATPAKTQFKKIGVLGAGMMGAGIAYAAAKAGIQVILKDIDLATAQRGKQHSADLLNKKVQGRQLSEAEAKSVLDRISPTQDYESLKSCELIIEAVFEDRALKREVTEKALAHTSKSIIMASNTSTLPITSLAEASSQPGNFIGLHFFSPVDKMQLVEIIRGAETSEETLAKSFDFVRQIGKLPIVVNDSRGFYTSRVFGAYTQEGIAMLSEGQKPILIERAALHSGMPVGPLAVADEVSLTLFQKVRRASEADFDRIMQTPPQHPAFAVIDRMVDEFNRKGKAAGAGFYDYPENARKILWPKLQDLHAGHELPFQDIKDRLLFIQSIETVRILEEKVLNSVADANIGSIFGFGFAAWTGGTLQFINSYGLRAFTIRAQELEQHYGARFKAPQLLINMSERNQTFK